jgi:HSP20 family protein
MMFEERNIYPGLYTPTIDIEGLRYANAQDVENVNEIPAVSETEFEDHFLIELSLPDTPRENIMIYVQDEVISIVIKDAGVHVRGLHSKRLDEKGCASHNIKLPGHIETGFISASFRKGLLRIYVPKCIEKGEISKQEVVIY